MSPSSARTVRVCALQLVPSPSPPSMAQGIPAAMRRAVVSRGRQLSALGEAPPGEDAAAFAEGLTSSAASHHHRRADAAWEQTNRHIGEARLRH